MTKEKMHKLLDIAIHCDGIELVCQRLAGVSPSGFDQRLVEELAKRANKEPTGLADSTVVGQTKVRVELEWAADRLRKKAAECEHNERIYRHEPQRQSNADCWRDKAAACHVAVALILKQIKAEPSPPSEAEVVEEVGCREYLSGISCQIRNEMLWTRCKQCPTGGDDVSGACLPNSDIQES